MDGQINREMDELIDRCTARMLDRQNRNGWIDKERDGDMNGQINREIEIWMDR